MTLYDHAAQIGASREEFATHFDSEPFGFTHRLSTLDLFSLDSLVRLARSQRAADYFVASGARTAATEFYAVSHNVDKPDEAIAALDHKSVRVLLKRPELYDRRFRELLDVLFAKIVHCAGGDIGQIVRLQSSILISSAATITPFHFDPEVSFFFQIAGPKTYHLYSPTVVQESELEGFYQRGVVDIAQVELGGRDPAREYVFELGPGLGMHQPRNAPHWVQTRTSPSISYVISYDFGDARD
jgi:hypothetical protein